MKLLGLIIVSLSLALGVASATTAYLPRLDLPDEQLMDLTLNADAGAVTTPDLGPRERPDPIAKDGQVVTPELLQELRNAGVARIRVTEFSLVRWTEAWLFLLACFWLLAGAFLVRIGNRREYRGRFGLAQPPAADTSTRSPEKTLQEIELVLVSLQQELPAMKSEGDRLTAIIERLGRVQREQVTAFADMRNELVAQLGLAGYARLMDRFAGMERQINRAWSAAADAVYEEAAECIDRAVMLSTGLAGEVVGE